MKTLPGFALSTALVILLGIVIVGGAGYVAVYPEVLKAPVAEPGDEAEQEADTTADSSSAASGKVTVAWTIEDLGEDEYSQPRNRISAIINGTSHEVGTFNGNCGEVGAEKESFYMETLADSGAVAGVSCYWAGYGDEIGIFKTDAGLSIRTREIGEGTGVSGPSQTEFTTKLDLKLMQ